MDVGDIETNKKSPGFGLFCLQLMLICGCEHGSALAVRRATRDRAAAAGCAVCGRVRRSLLTALPEHAGPVFLREHAFLHFLLAESPAVAFACKRSAHTCTFFRGKGFFTDPVVFYCASGRVSSPSFPASAGGSIFRKIRSKRYAHTIAEQENQKRKNTMLPSRK